MIRIGVIAPAEIAQRRFLPALHKCNHNIIFAGVAVCNDDEREVEKFCKITVEQLKEKRDKQLMKAQKIIEVYGGKIYYGYSSMIMSREIDAIYIPLPPALHYKWAKDCLEHGKHVLLEKPFTTNEKYTLDLLKIAKQQKLAVIENYMFVYHEQVEAIKNMIQDNMLGTVRLYEAKFGFPKRPEGDFRYNRFLGGGALFDCGGYLIKSASIFLKENFEILYVLSNKTDDSEVDLYGSAAFRNAYGEVMHIAYGMDNAYQCEMSVWGSKAILRAERFFTAPPQLAPNIKISYSDGTVQEIAITPCDTFRKSIEHFENCIENLKDREMAYKEIERQALYMERFVQMSDFR